MYTDSALLLLDLSAFAIAVRDAKSQSSVGKFYRAIDLIFLLTSQFLYTRLPKQLRWIMIISKVFTRVCADWFSFTIQGLNLS